MEDFRTHLTEAWKRTSELANWGVTQCLQHEPCRVPGQSLPALKIQLYKLFQSYGKRVEWDGMTQSAAIILRATEGVYRKHRFAVQVTQSETAPTFGWSFMPFPISRQGWHIREEHEHYVLSIPLGIDRYDIRLQNGHESRFALQQLRAVCDGDAIAGELKICGVRVSKSARRAGLKLRRPGGGESKFVRVFVRISAYIPRTKAAPSHGVIMRVDTSQDSMLVVRVGEQDPWVFHGDHIRNTLIARDRQLQRWADDTKFERRMPARKRRIRNSHLDRHAEKHRRRLDSMTKEMVANTINYAVRQRVDTIVLGDTRGLFCPRFGWKRFFDQFHRKATEVGIRIISSDDVPTPTSDPLEEETPMA